VGEKCTPARIDVADVQSRKLIDRPRPENYLLPPCPLDRKPLDNKRAPVSANF
jgi:hypothetical protein